MNHGTAELRNLGPGPISVKEAAAVLGISERAVRKRIAAGTLHAEQVDRAWNVYLGSAEPGPEPEQGRSTTEPRPRAVRAAVPDPPEQLQLIMKQWLVPLVDRIGSLERELGREQVLRESAEQERDELRRRDAALAEVRAAHAALTAELRRRAELAEAEAARLAAEAENLTNHYVGARSRAEETDAQPVDERQDLARSHKSWWRFWT